MDLSVEALTKSFLHQGRPLPVLDRVTLSARRGEFVVLVGPSGCGKSTLFNIIAGLVRPDGGAMALDGVPCVDARGFVGYMQQKDLLLPWRTVLGNAILGLEVRGVSWAEAVPRARALLVRVGLAEFANAYPARLSGGMRQRAALVRTVLCGTPILLLDEPFGALDAMTRLAMHGWLLRLWEEFRPTVLFITHDVEEALLLADRVYVFTARPGRIREVLDVPLPRPRRAADTGLV
ncbi:MAG: ABC transporter ATP-binding protein, partial [Armatimonadetes bacterium]|nr:ABC transporter ATP-binding protein [Armatimonadota bacterium]